MQGLTIKMDLHTRKARLVARRSLTVAMKEETLAASVVSRDAV